MTTLVEAADASELPSPTTAVDARSARGGRILGLDAARGLAVLGMIGAHLVIVDAFDWAYPESWFDLVNGRSAILFGLMAGVSLSLVSARGRRVGGVELLRTRMSILVRALAIFVIGTALEVIDPGFPIILQTYAVLFVAGAWLISVRSRTLIVAASVIALVSPILVMLSRSVFYWSETEPGVVETELVYIVVLSEFAAVVWVPFLMIGIVVGRLDLGALRVHVRLLVVGVVLMIVGYGLGELGNALAPDDLSNESWEGRWWGLALQYPHSATTSEVVGSAGFALVVLALCLALGSTRAGRVLLYPVAAVGAMALTAYAGHFIAIILLGEYAAYSTEYGVFAQFVIVTIVACVVWRVLFGSGPLEQVVTQLARRGARIIA